MAKKTEVLDGWVSTLGELGVSVAPQVLEAYFKGQKIGPSQVNDDLLLAHADAIRSYAAAPQLVSADEPDAAELDFVALVERQSGQVQGLSQELRPWIERKAEVDGAAIANVLTSYGPLVMAQIQRQVANDPFGAQIATFRRQLEELAGVAADAPALAASPEG
jgi:hypothetical protein